VSQKRRKNQAVPKAQEPPSAFTSIITSLIPGTSSKDDSGESQGQADASGTHSDHEGEAGWIGSGVWGLSAVGQKQRQADRERDDKVAGGQEVEDDGGKRQRQIEWEGFLRYAEQKERGEFSPDVFNVI
jgi:solute carrier family 25 phosphate transporter 23/24/25/41